LGRIPQPQPVSRTWWVIQSVDNGYWSDSGKSHIYREELTNWALEYFDTQLLPDRFTLPLAALGLGINSYAIYTTANVYHQSRQAVSKLNHANN